MSQPNNPVSTTIKSKEAAPLDLDFKKAELRLKKRELALKIVESRRIRWSTPLVIALITLCGGLIAGVLQYQQQRNALELESKNSAMTFNAQRPIGSCLPLKTIRRHTPKVRPH